MLLLLMRNGAPFACVPSELTKNISNKIVFDSLIIYSHKLTI